MFFYAVANGKNPGIYTTWSECHEQVKGYKNAKYKKFYTKEEANRFIEENATKHDGDDPDDILSSTKPTDFIPDYFVYTDGACSHNGSKEAAAGIGIYFGENDTRNVSKRIQGKQTNNTAELTALIETHRIINPDLQIGKKIMIVSDSRYAIRCVTDYGKKCQQNDYKVKGEDIPNRELVQYAYELYKNQPNVQFLHCKAHTNQVDVHSLGNDAADKLANESIGLSSCPYHHHRDKIYMAVPFSQKDEIKLLGGKWDIHKKQWYIYENNPHKDKILSLFTTTTTSS